MKLYTLLAALCIAAFCTMVYDVEFLKMLLKVIVDNW